MTLLDDSAIIDLFFERSEQAIDELDKKHGKAVRKTASNLLHDRQDAEECANDAFSNSSFITFIKVFSIAAHRFN